LSETTPKSITNAILALRPGQTPVAATKASGIAAAVESAPPTTAKSRKKPHSILDAIIAIQPAPIEAEPPKGPRWGRLSPEQRAALDRSIARQKADRKTRRKPPAIDRMVVLMEPGRWYSAPDLARGIGGGRGEACRVGDTLRKRGLVVRAQNKGWPGRRLGVGRTWRLYEPKWLFRLTDLGEAWRNQCVLTA
jgi:hypothetical protein